MTDSSGNTELEQSMALALTGSRAAFEAFFPVFLHGPLYVPERQQQRTLANQPDYPSPFTTILAVKGEEETVVPVFSRPELIREWCGEELVYRAFEGRSLVTVVPDGWHISLNPGSEEGKELTPWEIKELRLGEEAIPGIVAELLADEPLDVLEVGEPGPDEYQELKAVLEREAARIPEVTALYLLKETAQDAEGLEAVQIILGIAVDPAAHEKTEAIQETLSSAARLSLIGRERLKVRAGCGEDSLMLGMFRGRAFYRRRASIFSRIRRLFYRTGRSGFVIAG